MNRINQLFQNKTKNILSIYFCAGHPTKEGTVDVIEALESNGVDLIEIGIPYSDPMADGVVIQKAANMALDNGMTLKLLFSQLANVRDRVEIPLILMGYLNPIMQYGFEDFCKKCAACGIDGVIIPDLPYAEYKQSYEPIANMYDIKVIMLITPETSDERVIQIDNSVDAFIYVVSSAATTGVQESFKGTTQDYFNRIESLKLKNPCLVGFGISNEQTFNSACEYSSGGIVGSKFVNLLESTDTPHQAILELKDTLGIS